MPFPKKKLTLQQAKLKIARYCAYQDRCKKEVVTKLKEYGLDDVAIDELVDFLMDEKYLDEKRFVTSYVNGKFNLKKWGKLKIKAHLRAKDISDHVIDNALANIPIIAYHQTVTTLIARKKELVKETDPFIIKQKVVAFLQQKGYELDFIFENYTD